MAVRIITFSDFTEHTASLFNQLHIFDIYKLHKLQIGSFIYDLVHSDLPHIASYLLITTVHAIKV